MSKQSGATPLMKQYFEIREQHPDTLLFFQVGDFYELFFEDAKMASAFLGIALTKRGQHEGEPIPLCGVPVHALDHYLTKLIRGGYRVAICDQLEQATPGKVVQRGVTKVLTPGTLTDSKLLDDKSASYLFSFFPQENTWGLLFGELLTAQLFATVLPANSERLLESELARFIPDEILVPHTPSGKQFASFFKKHGYATTFGDAGSEQDDMQDLTTWMSKQFAQDKCTHISQQQSLQRALLNFYRFLMKNQRDALDQFKQLYIYEPEDFLVLDAPTQRNLELIKNNQDGSSKHTLFSVLDRASTPMGSRMIKKWLLRPLIKQAAIEQRLAAVEYYVQDTHAVTRTEQSFASIGDLERVIGRIALSRAHLHDYLMLKSALKALPQLKEYFSFAHNITLLNQVARSITDFSPLEKLLESALNDDLSKDWLIKKGFDKKLDELRVLVADADGSILALERKEQERTGIQSLKIRYNNVHGYYIEVTKANLDAVPEDYIRQQTLVGRERFMTKELQELQVQLMQARNEITEVEKAVFERVKSDVAQYVGPLRKAAHVLAHVDAIIGFAKTAYEHQYTRPTFVENTDIVITQGRHPVVERTSNAQFIPNDTHLTDEESVWIVTGPNMGGKSTYLRQVALTAVMAHCGSFVPAKSAQLPILDRIFTRIGSGDNLAEGKSTFLVEMEETAAICSYATKNSLVILDEVGRGTSTFDGLAIAQAVVEYIYKAIQARCLFATHYHELTLLQDTYPGISSYFMRSKKTDDGIVFLYTMSKGIADGSFGVEVAKLAQLPMPVVVRAQQILKTLTDIEQSHAQSINAAVATKSDDATQALVVENTQLKDQLLQMHEALKKSKSVLSQLQSIEYDDLSPKKAFDLLWKLKEL